MESNLKPRELHGIKLWGYASGIFGQVLPNTLLNAYLFIFFVYTVGLDALAVSIGTAIGAIVNAVGAIIFGTLSDQKVPGRWGKRKFFMLWSIPGIIVGFIGVWIIPLIFPPNRFSWELIVFLWVLVIVYYLFYSMFRSSYLATLPEQSQSNDNRVKISSIQAMFSLLGSVLGIILPMIIQAQLENPQNPGYNTPDGQLLISLLPIVAIGFTLIGVGLMFWAYHSIDERDLMLPKPANSKINEVTSLRKDKSIHEVKSMHEGKSLKTSLMGILQPFQDKNYRKFLLSQLNMNAGMRIIVKILAPYMTFVLLLQQSEFLSFTAFLLPFAGLGFVLWQKVVKKQGLKKAYLFANGIITLFLFSTVILIPDMPKIVRIIIAVVIMGGTISTLVACFIYPNPIISRLVDQAQIRLIDQSNIIENQESRTISGIYFGTWVFMLNFANTLGDLLIGLILTGGNESNPLIIGIILPVCGVLYALTVIFFKSIKLENQT